MNDPNARRVVRIEHEFSDGEIRQATGDDAEAIHEHEISMLTEHYLRTRRKYTGPFMKVVKLARVVIANDDEWRERIAESETLGLLPWRSEEQLLRLDAVDSAIDDYEEKLRTEDIS